MQDDLGLPKAAEMFAMQFVRVVHTTRFTVGAAAVNNNGQTSMDRLSLEEAFVRFVCVCVSMRRRILRQSSGHIPRWSKTP